MSHAPNITADADFRTSNGHDVLFMHSGAEVVATLWLTGVDRGLSIDDQRTETMATARLFEAAPDLLKACFAIRERIRCGGSDQNTLDKLDAAIAKATRTA
ncbi:MAG: hypothetical protein IT428_05995 [Planctomycetaceae bacterium]|nr:hypothetical protein [Planctomycetaceae bacterium]